MLYLTSANENEEISEEFEKCQVWRKNQLIFFKPCSYHIPCIQLYKELLSSLSLLPSLFLFSQTRNSFPLSSFRFLSINTEGRAVWLPKLPIKASRKFLPRAAFGAIGGGQCLKATAAAFFERQDTTETKISQPIRVFFPSLSEKQETEGSELRRLAK